MSNTINFIKKKELSKSKKPDSNRIREIIIDLLKHGTQGKDLLADKVIKELGIICRGKDRQKLKRKIEKIVREMQVEEIVEEYKTDKRTRLQLKS